MIPMAGVRIACRHYTVAIGYLNGDAIVVAEQSLSFAEPLFLPLPVVTELLLRNRNFLL